MSQLTLFYMPTCPYCRKVTHYMEQHHIELPLKNTLENTQNRLELQKIGGKTQVPCLVIDGRALYESDDIIEWLKKNLATSTN